MHVSPDLSSYGWRDFFARQLGDDHAEGERVVRVVAVHRGALLLDGPGFAEPMRVAAPRVEDELALPTVGDWVVINPAAPQKMRLLDRFSLFKRRAAGSDHRLQLIAANVDTLLIVTSANRDFNVARLERYLALARESGAYPVVVITKADLADNARELATQASQLQPGLICEVLDGRDPDAVAVLRSWCGPGQTVALVGSSGVGKSTLINTLSGARQDVNAAREQDQRGRHTTTGRSLHKLSDGGWLVDTPGMRELKLVDVEDALDDVFAEVSALADACRFADCQHEAEPGCAIRAAVDRGDLTADRLRRYEKLKAENRRNSESLSERRARDRSLSKLYKSVQHDRRSQKGNN